MGVGRQVNWKGQWRVDVPHLRALESGVAYDFDVLAGVIMTGKLPYVVTGFVPGYTLGTDATLMQINVAGAAVMNYAASESGTILKVPDNRAPETLTVANTRVSGGFAAGQDNYIGLDFTRQADSSTVDIVQFLDATSITETAKSVPLARTLDYLIVISTTPFINTPHLAPVCIVTTDANNKIAVVKDARSLVFRLANGGDSPNALGKYNWPQGRGIGVSPTQEIAAFTGGDKAIGDMKTWMSAIMTSIWEIKGGERWYSDTTDRNLQFIRIVPGTLPDNIVWDGATLKWEGLGVLMSGSTGVTNEIVNNIGGTALADGWCFYVDLDRTQDRLRSGSPLTVGTAAIGNLGTPTMPGSRYVFAWRQGAKVYARGQFWDVQRQVVPIATAATLGVVKGGSNVAIAGDGTLSVAFPGAVAATTTTLGSVIVPTSGHLNVDGSGNISVPVAAAGTLGVIRIGSGLAIDGSGIVSVTFPPAGGVTDLTTPDGVNHVGSVSLTHSNLIQVQRWGMGGNGTTVVDYTAGEPANGHPVQIGWTGMSPVSPLHQAKLQWIVDGTDPSGQSGFLASSITGANVDIDAIVATIPDKTKNFVAPVSYANNAESPHVSIAGGGGPVVISISASFTPVAGQVYRLVAWAWIMSIGGTGDMTLSFIDSATSTEIAFPVVVHPNTSGGSNSMNPGWRYAHCYGTFVAPDTTNRSIWLAVTSPVNTETAGHGCYVF